MKTQKHLSLTLILITFFHALSYAVIFSRENSGNNSGNVKSVSAKKIEKQFVHVTFNNGKLIPQVNLPVITIYAERNIKNKIPIAIRGNETIANVDLPEIVITAEKKTTGFKLRIESGKNSVLALADLPEVEISAKRSVTNSFTWQKTNKNNVPVVNLPEVIITGDFPEHNKVKAVLYKGDFIASVILPEVEITAAKPETLKVSDDEERSAKNVDFNFGDFMKAEAKTNQSLNIIILILTKTSSLKF